MSGWDEAKVSLLKKLWSEGLSASQVAARLGGGITRNAVCGKVDRLGLPPRVSNVRAKSRKRRTNAPRIPNQDRRAQNGRNFPNPARSDEPLDPMKEPEVPPAPEMRNISLAKLTNGSCRWAIGDPQDEDFSFCGAHGANLASGKPYCEFHSRIAYQPPASRREKRRAAA